MLEERISVSPCEDGTRLAVDVYRPDKREKYRAYARPSITRDFQPRHRGHTARRNRARATLVRPP